MHGEAFTYTRQTLAYSQPAIAGVAPERRAGPLPGDVEVEGARLLLGAKADETFVFDNEKWAHPVDVASFRIARAPVTNEEYAGFVEDGGYRDSRLWSEEGWRWREGVQAGGRCTGKKDASSAGTTRCSRWPARARHPRLLA